MIKSGKRESWRRKPWKPHAEKTGNKLLECVKKEKISIREHRVKVVGMVKRRYTDDI